MHTCSVPAEALNEWLEKYLTVENNYGHALLEQKDIHIDSLAKKLRPYFESAHQDARKHFHDAIGIDLHPDATDIPTVGHALYPGCLPPTARHGLFGEVMCGMLTEHYEFVGQHDWTVPAFLFRYHGDVEAYLFALVRDPTRKRQVFGRFGSDFLALALDDTGKVVRYLVGEAKWRKALSQSVVDSLLLGKWIKDDDGNRVRDNDGIWNQLNVDALIPHGMRQMQRLLQELDPDGMSEAILSIDRAIMIKNNEPIERTNLVLICGNANATRKSCDVFIGWEDKPIEYTAPHDLQVIELVLSDGENLIKKIYDSLWGGS
ncbi:aminotransferase [Oxalobacteraceae bacterium]|nr:aminotransferase [Oxalobacteraceae bacterium]